MEFVVLGVVLLLALVVARRALSSVRTMRRLVADEHWREIAAVVPVLREASLTERDVPPHPPHDARAAVTSEGVAIFLSTLTVPERGLLLTHLSLSRRGGFIPWSAAGQFAFLILHQCGIRPDAASASHGRAGIAHVLFTEPLARSASLAVVGLPADLTALKEHASDFVRTTAQSGDLRREEREHIQAVLRAA